MAPVQVFFIGGGADSVAEVSLATYAGVVDEGSGWYEVTIPYAEFSNPELIWA